MAACLLVTLPLELVLKAGVYRRPRRWLAAVVPVFLVFNLWDWVAIRRGHWTYSPRYTTGIELLGLPWRSWSSSWSSRPARCSPTRPSSACSRPGTGGGAAVIPEYTMASACGVALTVLLEVLVLRTGLFRDPATGSPWPSWPPSSCW